MNNKGIWFYPSLGVRRYLLRRLTFEQAILLYRLGFTLKLYKGACNE